MIFQTATMIGGPIEDIIANYSDMNNSNCGEILTDEDWKIINSYRQGYDIAKHGIEVSEIPNYEVNPCCSFNDYVL